MSSRTRPKRGYSVGVERRNQILDAAMAEFAASGYRGASLAQVAERVGLTQPGLLHHFRSKEELLVGVLERRDELDAIALGLETDMVSMGRGFSGLRALVQLVERNASRRGIVQLFTVLIGESVTDGHPAQEWAHKRYAWIRGLIVNSVREGMDDGEIREDADPVAVATGLVAMMDGLQLQWLHDPESVDMAGLFRRYVDELTADLRTKVAGRRSGR
ncbi:MAG TPA: TetR family transcriptional regulator [Micromonosporaceae bacterium]|nr:TetR family transcriptional regulator [Micromonosporaceae bacterium]HCU51533.1 TetR family transcriptional regulator [Micromonosporaceae bacterium]